ncbi:hypothetical protein [Leisingera sp. ANG-Vp]|uniref:hypothetical protein n=1 Tax=Leisingera sp. ANG-Vp TaxID=1577896 RepID=UPI00057DF1FA|nr:hypothetical protein [Leisingera sp. ANG-Vp]KIC20352.1 hypothetical protein RA20_09055 [Leisingera sp. ANG-Vp]
MMLALIFRLPEELIIALEQSFQVDAGSLLSLIGLISRSQAAVAGLLGQGAVCGRSAAGGSAALS